MISERMMLGKDGTTVDRDLTASFFSHRTWGGEAIPNLLREDSDDVRYGILDECSEHGSGYRYIQRSFGDS